MPGGLPRRQRRSSLAWRVGLSRARRRACLLRAVSAVQQRPKTARQACLCMRDGKNCQALLPVVEMLVSLRAASLARLRVDA